MKNSRLIKRRTVAKEFCDRGKALVNGSPGKPSTAIQPGDTIRLDFGPHILEIEVLSIERPKRKGESGDIYRVIKEMKVF